MSASLITSDEWKAIGYVGGLVLTNTITYFLTRLNFQRQRKTVPLDAFLVFLSTEKNKIPKLGGYLGYHFEQKRIVPLEYAKLEPFLSNRKKAKYQKAWKEFCDIGNTELNDKYESNYASSMHDQLTVLANLPKSKPIEKTK